MNIKFIKNKSKKEKFRREVNNKQNPKNIIIFFLSLLFLIGLIIGIFYFKNIINSNFFEDNSNILESVDLVNKSKIDIKNLFFETLFRNMIILIFTWIIGLSILGVPILIFYVLYDGFSLGITLSYVLNTFGVYEGYVFLYSTMYITTIINTLALILLCNSAIRVTMNILKQKTSLKSEFIRHSLVCILMLIFLVISSVIEVYLIKVY